MEYENILLAHGSGGKLTHNLIKDLFAKYFENEYLSPLSDSAIIDLSDNKIAFTTDSYVINPIVFPGGNIGKLAICGTVNDLAVAGAKPLYISCGFIIEEGLKLSLLEEIVSSMANAAKEAGVKIVTGDTKVVEHGSADKIFINTAGIGIRDDGFDISYKGIKPGDKIIINGNIGDHGMAVMAAREGLNMTSTLTSDCATLNGLIEGLKEAFKSDIKFMRDPTRGGVATTLCEIASETNYEVIIEETSLPINEEVNGLSEVLGIDPLFSANEGKVIFVVSSDTAEDILSKIKSNPLGRDAKIIGTITETMSGKVFVETEIGTRRQVSMLTGNQLPRIC